MAPFSRKLNDTVNMVRDIARNSYERGFDDGFKRGFKRGVGYGLGYGTLGWASVALILFGLAMLSGCTTLVAEGGFGHQIDGNLVGRSPAATVYIGLESDDLGPLRASCGWLHISHLREGTPFNENDETWADLAHCKVRAEFRLR